MLQHTIRNLKSANRKEILLFCDQIWSNVFSFLPLYFYLLHTIPPKYKVLFGTTKKKQLLYFAICFPNIIYAGCTSGHGIIIISK